MARISKKPIDYVEKWLFALVRFAWSAFKVRWLAFQLWRAGRHSLRVQAERKHRQARLDGLS